MIISEILGNLEQVDIQSYCVDFVHVEWYNTQKRIARYISDNGEEVAIRFEKIPKDGLSQGDILFQDGEKIIAVAIVPVDILRICVKDIKQVAGICYEIGNYHIPLFFGTDVYEFKTPFESPLERLLNRLCIPNWREHGILDSKKRLKVHLPIVEPQLKIAQDFHITLKE